jgi:hypothetical protein
MIIITSLKYYEVAGNEDQVVERCDDLLRRDFRTLVPVTDDGRRSARVAVDVVRDVVQGHHFVTADGEGITIGATCPAREVLGLPFEVIENLKVEIESIRHSEHYAKKRLLEAEAVIQAYNSASLWQRIKWAFSPAVEGE